MALIDKLISSSSPCSTLKSDPRLQGYTGPGTTQNNDNLACNLGVTFVTSVTSEEYLDEKQPVMRLQAERPKEWTEALDIFKKVHDFSEQLFNDNPNLWTAIESNPVLLKTEENMDSLAIQIRKEAAKDTRQSLLEQLKTAGRFYLKKLKAIKSTL